MYFDDLDMSTQYTKSDSINFTPGSPNCLLDLLRSDPSTSWSCQTDRQRLSSGPRRRLELVLNQTGNNICADCGFSDPKWVSLSLGVFICIKCSGIHRSLGANISKVLSVKLDEWTDEQVDTLVGFGGNNAVNMKYELCVPKHCKKPKPNSSIEERSNFIRRKYELKEFIGFEEHMACTLPSPLTISSPVQEKKQMDKNRKHRLSQAFRNSWRRKDHEPKVPKKSTSVAGMVEFVGLIKVNVVRGTNLAIRDILTSDPYVIITLGQQSMKTRVIRNNLNPVWNEWLMLSIPEHIPPLKVLVYDKDTFTPDDFMGEAEIDIQPLVTAAIAYENSAIEEPMQLGKWIACRENTLVRDSVINLIGGRVKQDIVLRLQKVERGVLDIELECVPLTQ